MEAIINKKSGERRSGGLTTNELASFRQENSKQYENLNEMKNRVLLRLDPKDHPNLIKKIDYLTIAFYESTCSNLEEVRTRQKDVVEATQAAIKEAWTKVKQGEKTFSRVRTFLEYVLVALVVLFGGVAVAFGIMKYLRLI